MKQRTEPANSLPPCSLCGRTPPRADVLEQHHLVPRAHKGRDTITVCIDCGDQLHRLFTLHELRDTFNSLSRLREDERVRRWIGWIRKQRRFGVCMKHKKRK